jgi:hypothetical protein
MDCSCIRGNYNYYAEAIDTKTIIYQDLSDWMDDEGYIYPVDYQVSITPPTSSQPKIFTMRVGEMNRISSEDIGHIRDGIYCFTVVSCGDRYVRSQAIFPHLRCCVKQAWATLGIEWQEAIEEIENHLKLATINAELNNVQLASKELKIAKKLLENIKCDCDC